MAASISASAGANGAAKPASTSSCRRMLSWAKRSISMRPACCIARRRCSSVSGGTSSARTRHWQTASNGGSTNCRTTCHSASARRMVMVTVGWARVTVATSTSPSMPRRVACHRIHTFSWPLLSSLPPGEGAQTLTLRLTPQGAIDFFRRNRQVADAHADGVRYSVGDRWRYRRESALTDTLDPVGTDPVWRLHQYRRQRWCIAHRRQLVFAKGEVRHTAVLDLQLFHQSIAEALHEGALNLPLVADRVDDLADIMGRGEAPELHLPRLGVNRDLRYLHGEGGDVGAPALLNVGAAGDRGVGAGEQVRPGDHVLAVSIADLAASHGEPLLWPVQLACRQPQQLAFGLLHRFVGHNGVNAGGPAAGHARVEGDGVCVPDLHLDALQRHLQLLCHDLTQGGVRAGPLIEDRCPQEYTTVRPQSDGR